MNRFDIGATVVVWAIVMAVFGCTPATPVDAPPANSKYDNALTHRQKLVEQFGTAEIHMLPYHADEFVVRDTNGAVWYVFAVKDSDQRGRTMLFNSKLAEQDPIFQTPVTNIVSGTNTSNGTNINIKLEE